MTPTLRLKRNARVIAVCKRAVTPKYQLYDYQRQVLSDILAALSTVDRRVVAHLPTGAGKTRVACHAACSLLNRSDPSRSLVIWLAATEELCEQAADELTKAWTHLGLRTASVHRHWGRHSLDLRSLSSGFLVTGLAKLHSVATSDSPLLAGLANAAVGVIFDEAHQAIAATYRYVTEQLCSARCPLLGLTATPGRTAHPTDDDHRLADMFCRNKVTIDPRGHGSPVTFLIANRYLARPRFVPISFESRDYIPNPPLGVDYPIGDLERLGRQDERTRKICRLASQAAARHHRTIVFCPSVESAVECNNILSSQGMIRTHAITAETPREQRRAAIADFRGADPVPMVLFNYGVLTAGFDAPHTRCVIIARPTTSLVLYSQMAGRAMRGPRAGGNSFAEILTVADTSLPGFASVTDAFTNWEEIWTTN